MTQTGDLARIDGLSEAGMELLVAVGIEDVVSLARSDSQWLAREMAVANQHLQLYDDSPIDSEVETWIEKALNVAGPRATKPVEQSKPTRETPAQAAVLRVYGLDAVQLSPDYIADNKIAITDLPAMEDFVKEDSAERVVVSDPVAPKPEKPKAGRNSLLNREIAARPIDQSQPVTRGIDETKEKADVQPLEKGGGFDIRKMPSAEINAGKKPHSRGYVRGVLHPTPGKVKFGALITLIAQILLPLSFAAGIILLLKRDEFLWVAWIPAAFLVFGLLYIMLARGRNCRVCGQPLFSPKSCRRHTKSHHIPLIGYIFPTAIHMLLFHWFRCIYCGTSVRLKK